MHLVQYIAMAFAPGLVWLWFFRSKDRLEPEPRWLVVRAFALGCLAPIVILWTRPWAERLLPVSPGLIRNLIDAFLVTALCEELVKLAAFAVGILFHRELDEPMDGVVYGTAVALGFASVENVLFLVSTSDPALVVQRTFTATLLHVACTGTLGIGVALARLSSVWTRWFFVASGLLFAVTFHGLYDLFLNWSPSHGFASLLLILPVLLLMFALNVRWCRAQSSFFHAS